jgi:PAS domain S-box-containing protein
MRLAYVVLALSLVTTALVYSRVKSNVAMREHVRFNRAVQNEKLSIEQRVPRYVDEMLSVRGLFLADGTVTSEQWQQFLSGIDVERSYPGIRSLGYMERVVETDRDKFLRKINARVGVTDFHIQPEGDRKNYFPVVYVSHFETDADSGLGQDHFANRERQRIMEQAWNAGQPMATGKIRLTPEGTNSDAYSFTIYLPVYRAGVAKDTETEKRTALQGFVFANLDTGKLMEGILGHPTNALDNCEVYDGADMTAARLLYSSDRNAHVLDKRPNQQAESYSIPMLNRKWTVYFSSLPPFENDTEHHLPTIVLICWLTLSFLLFGLTAAEVTSRSRAAAITADLRKSEAALAAEKERLAVTLYSIGDGVITTDTNGDVTLINKIAEQLTGWSQTEAAGKPLKSLFKTMHATTRQPMPNPVEVVLRTASIFNLDQTVILVGRDGAERAVADSAAPIRDREGSVIGAVLVFRDVTAKQKSEAELLKESKLESVGLLAGGIAHDFNNILQGILGNLSLARMNAHSIEKMLERVERVEKSAMRAKDLTQQLVMFARGGAPIRKPVQITGLVKDATTFALHGSNVTCEFSLATDAWLVDVDEGQFRQVINNIALNAVQAMAEGGKIEVRVENVELMTGHLPPLKEGKYVKISIRDYGTGIRPEHLQRVFDPYFTTRPGARGLGLASAYSVVRKHDGQIKVESEISKGTTFQIYLPASARAAEAPARESEQKRFFGRGRVLIMDDEVDILTLAGEMLKVMGYEVETAKDGTEALEKYAVAANGGHPFSVVIMDLTIPEGMGGKEAIRRLKALDPQVKAIVSSGYSYDPVMANFQEHGFSGVIPKPYVMDELGRVLAEVEGKNTNSPTAPS